MMGAQLARELARRQLVEAERGQEVVVLDEVAP
jgi:hypothetical protein